MPSEMSHQPLIDSLTEFYNVLAALKYIRTSDIILPPPNGHTNVDVEAALEQNFGDEMISLMRQLPYLSRDCDDTRIAVPTDTKPRSYLDEDYLDWARDPIFKGFNITKDTHLVLTNPGSSGITLIYDTVTCKLVPWCPSRKDVRSPDGAEYADETSFPPDELLGQWTRNWTSLTWLPFCEPNGWRYLIPEPSMAELKQASSTQSLREQFQLKLLQRNMKDVYVAAGWNVDAQDVQSAQSNFNGNLFAHKSFEWRKSTQALLDKAYQERWTWAQIRAGLNLEPESSSPLDCELTPDAKDIASSRRLNMRPDANNPYPHFRI